MTTTIDKNQWCGQFKRCNGCKLQSECMVKPEEMFPVMENGKYVDKWAIRTTAMIARELGGLLTSNRSMMDKAIATGGKILSPSGEKMILLLVHHQAK